MSEHIHNNIPTSSIAESTIKAVGLDSAILILEEQLCLFQRAMGPSHPNTVRACLMLAEAYRSNNMAKSALEAERQAYEGIALMVGECHIDTADSCLRLMEGYWELGDKKNAFTYALKAFQIFKNNVSSNNPIISNMVQQIIDMYFQMGENEAFRAKNEYPHNSETASIEEEKIEARHRFNAKFLPICPLPQPISDVPGEAWKVVAVSPHSYLILSYRLTERQFLALSLAAEGYKLEDIAQGVGLSKKDLERTLYNAITRVEYLIAAGKLTCDGMPVYEPGEACWLEVLSNRASYTALENILTFPELDFARLISQGTTIDTIARAMKINKAEATQIADGIKKSVNCYLSEGELTRFLPTARRLPLHRRLHRKGQPVAFDMPTGKKPVLMRRQKKRGLPS